MTVGVKAALACAIGSGVCLHLYLARYEADVRGGELVSVLSLSRDVKVGTLVGEDDLDRRQLPERYVDERHVPAEDLHRVVGNRVQVAVAAGDALLWTDIGVYEAIAPLAELVDVGRRAVRVEGDEVSFGGLLRPGDRVDVLWTDTEKGLLGGEPRTRTLLENVLVLAVGDRVTPEDGPSRGARGAVTLSVLPEQAERFESSRRSGRLSLSLRNPEDVAVEHVGEGEVAHAQ